MHGFPDASQHAIVACVYVRTIDTLNCIQVSLFYGKSEVAPIETLTIPKLELLAALLLSTVLGSKKIHIHKVVL